MHYTVSFFSQPLKIKYAACPFYKHAVKKNVKTFF